MDPGLAVAITLIALGCGCLAFAALLLVSSRPHHDADRRQLDG